jgi:tape measure domain-containing protein
MPSIDERVVAMSFENSVFEARVAQTMSTLNKLDASIRNIGSVNGLENIEKSANKVTLQGPMSALDRLKARFGRAGSDAGAGFDQIERQSNKVSLQGPSLALDKLKQKLGLIGSGNEFAGIQGQADRVNLNNLDGQVESTKNHFDALRFAAIVAFGTIVHKATNAGLQMVKAITVQPLIDGFHNYETQINAVQTIMANTGLTGKKGLGQVQAALNELNTYANQTVYNFSEMARNIGTFTAAGVDLKTATASIKGIANLAALSGSTSQQASTAMYQLSQAIAAGQVKLQDWNSVVNAGMGGKVFQQALANTAQAMGTLKDGSVKLVGPMKQLTVGGQSFRQSIQSVPGQKSWLTSDVLTKTLEQFTGDMTDAQLKAEGFSASQIKAIQTQAHAAVGAATNIKTISQLMQALKEEVATSWGAIFKTLFGDIFSATAVFSKLHIAAENALTGPVYALNKVLQGWAHLGGRSILIEGLKQGLKDIGLIIKPIKEAFRDIFPATTPQGLLAMTKSFRDLMVNLKPSAETVDGLRRTFRGLFAVLGIGWYLIKKVVGVFFDLLGVAGKGGGGFLKFTGGIGDFLTALEKAIVKGDAFAGVFKSITNVLRVPLEIIGHLAKAFFGLFGGVDTSKAKGAADGIKSVGDSLKPMSAILDKVSGAWHHFIDFLGNTVKPIAEKVAHGLANFGSVVVQAFQNMNFQPVFAIINTGLIGGILLALKKGFGSLGDAVKGAGGGFMGNVNAILKGLTGNLTAMQKNIQAGTLMKIAISIGVLAGGIALLSTIDPKKLTMAMTAVAVGLGQLVVALALLSKVTSGASFFSMPLMAASLVELSVAVTILAGAMKIMATMSWSDLIKGLVGVGGALLAMAVGLKAMSGPQLLIIGPGLIAVAVGMNILAVAMKIFAGFSWGEIAKGIVALGGSLLVMGAALDGLGPELLATGPGLIAAGFGLTVLAGAVSAFGHMNVGELAKGILGMGAALLVLGVAVAAIPPTVALQAAGLVILAVALTGIAGAIGLMGKMSIGTLAKGLVALAGALAILAIGLSAMEGTLPGAAALLAAAAALAVLAPTLAFMGSLSWDTIIKGLGAIAATLGVLSIVGLVASEGIAALGVALIPFGVAVLAAGAGMALLVWAFSQLGDQGQKSIATIVLAITAFVAALPGMVLGLVKGLLQVVQGITQLAPQIVASIVKIGSMLLSAIVQLAPKIAQAMGALVDMLFTVVIRDSPKLIQAGYTLMLNLLRGLDNNIGQIIFRASSIVIKFLTGLASRAPELTAAGARFIVAFLNGVANHIGDIVGAAVRVETNFLRGLASLPGRLLAIGVNAVLKFLSGIARSIPKLAKAGVNIVVKTLNGVSSQFGKVAKTATDFVVRFFNAFGSRANVAKMVSAGLNAAIHIMQGIADGMRHGNNIQRIINAAVDLGKSIVSGIAKGLVGLAKKLADKLLGPIKDAVNQVNDFLDIGSPSKLFARMGLWIVQGMANGLGGMGAMLYSGITQPLHQMLADNKDLKAFGEFLSGDFRKGLTGGLFDNNQNEAVTQIKGSFTALRGKLGEEQGKLRDQIKQDNDQLKQLMSSRDKNWGQINALEQRIANERATLAGAQMASHGLMNLMTLEQNALVKLAKQYQDVSTQLDAAKQSLDQLKQDRAQAVQQYIDQFSQTPDIAGLLDQAMQEASKTWDERWADQLKKQQDDRQRAQIDQVANYKQALQDQIAATQQYMATLGKLRAAGLDDTTYKKLLAMGTSGQEFASQLLAGGKGSIDQINALDAQLGKAASDLGNQAGRQLYDAGIQAAEGLVKGLQNKQAEIRKTMEDIASSLVHALKHMLGIRSPSQVMMELGQFTAQGLADGITGASKLVQDAASSVGNDAADALTNSLANISSRVQNGIDTDVTITPVLDLTQVQKDASKIQDLTNVVPITAAASYGQAAAISDQTQAQAAAAAVADSAPKTIEFNFEQKNESPKALDDVEIYRQTKNQLSQVKSALGLVTATNP